MQAHDGVSLVVWTAEDLPQLKLGQLLPDLRDFGRRFVQRFFALFIFGEIEKKTRLFKLGAILLPRLQNGFDTRLLFEDCLRLVGFVPEIGLGGELVQLFDALLLAVEVKDAS
jgi:hypothetical protein